MNNKLLNKFLLVKAKIPSYIKYYLNKRLLPYEYTKLDYIESTGTQYIDTNFKPNGSTEVICDLKVTNYVQGNQAFFGSRVSGSSKNFSVVCGGITSDLWYNGYNNGVTNTNIKVILNTKYNINKDKGYLYVNDIEFDNKTTATFESNLNMMIFCVNQNGSNTFFSKIKLYKFKIYDNGTLVRDFIPCYRKNDNVAGLYDVVSKTFFINSGTGEFIKGE